MNWPRSSASSGADRRHRRPARSKRCQHATIALRGSPSTRAAGAAARRRARWTRRRAGPSRRRRSRPPAGAGAGAAAAPALVQPAGEQQQGHRRGREHGHGEDGRQGPEQPAQGHGEARRQLVPGRAPGPRRRGRPEALGSALGTLVAGRGDGPSPVSTGSGPVEAAHVTTNVISSTAPATAATAPRDARPAPIGPDLLGAARPGQYDGWLGVDLVDPGDHAAADVHGVGVAGALERPRAPRRSGRRSCSAGRPACPAGSCSSALPLRNSPLGISTEPGIWLISYSFGSRTSTSTKSRLPFSRSLSMRSSWVTEIVEPAAASAASSEIAPQKLS